MRLRMSTWSPQATSCICVPGLPQARKGQAADLLDPPRAVMRRQLQPGEQVIVMTRPQPRTLIGPAAVFIGAPALGAFAIAWIVKGEATRLLPVAADWTALLVGGCILVVAWVLFAYCLPRNLQ